MSPLLAAVLVLVPLLSPEGALVRARSRIETLAKALAKDGLGPEAGTCVAAYGELGGDAERLADLQRDVERALGRAHAAPGDRQLERHAEAASEVASWLARAADEATDEALRADLLERALAFDQDCVQAHERAGHVRGPDGVFRSPLLTACHERRLAMARSLEKARQMPMEVERVEAKDPLLIALCGATPPSAVEHDGLVIESVWPVERLETVFRDVLRAMAWSNWLLRGTLAPVHSSGTFVHLLFKPEYEAYIAAARDAGALSPDEYAVAVKLSGTTVKERLGNGYGKAERTVHAITQGTLGTALLVRYDVALNSLPISSGDLPAWTVIGHANFVGLSFLGTRMPLYAKLEELDPNRTRATTSRFELSLPNAGLVGCRSYLRRLAVEGTAPSFSSILVPDLSDVIGVRLLKATSVAELLHERDGFETFFKGYTRSIRTGTETPTVKSEAGFGEPLPAFDAAWKEWLLADEPGRSLAGRLLARRSGERKEGDPKAARILAELNAAREAAGLAAVQLDGDLSASCALHARYLTAHPEQCSKWPDAHEEWTDAPDFTPAGAWAGGHSVIAFDGYERCVEQWIGTLYHRVPLTHPGLLAIGFAEVGDVCVLDSGSLVDPSADGIACYPFDGQKDVPLAFQPEMPNPVPSIEDQRLLGYPVTLQLGPNWGDIEVELSLRQGGDPVQCWISTPAAPSNPVVAPERTWCLIPAAPLSPSTTYTVQASLPSQTFSWSFTTEK